MAKSPTAALKFVVLLGFVSLCADATYEGARSLTGAYLGVLGASGTTVGWVAGLGELVSYSLRLFIGFLRDRTRRYWGITTFGYVFNTVVVPLMAFAGRWEVLAGLIIAERTGKAIRTPPRDVLLSHAAMRAGKAWVCTRRWTKLALWSGRCWSLRFWRPGGAIRGDLPF